MKIGRETTTEPKVLTETQPSEEKVFVQDCTLKNPETTDCNFCGTRAICDASRAE